MNNVKINQTGFTLIEVMVALTILAVVAVTASKVSQNHIHATANLKQRTLAHFVAQNMATDLRISGEWITSPTNRQVDMAGQSWQVMLTPSPLRVSRNQGSTGNKNGGLATDSDAIELMIQVAPIVDETVKSSLTDLTIVLARNHSKDLNTGFGENN